MYLNQETAERFPICVIGAGHGGLAMAGHLGLQGFPVRLFNRSAARLAAISSMGGIHLTGEVDGFGPVEKATDDMAEAIAGARLLMVVTPATAHREIAAQLAPVLEDGQIIVLNPGRTGGALEFRTVLIENKCRVHFDLAETQTFIYASRATNPGQAHIFRIKNTIPVAAFPAYRTPEVLKVLRVPFPHFVPGDNVLKTGLDNIGAIFHPTITLLNAARIESTHGDFEYYMEGITPSVAKILEALDEERVSVAAALGIRAMPAREWLYVAYDAVGKNLYEAIQNNVGYRGIRAPASVYHRYIWEDVPTSLVPIASLGDLLGVHTPVMDHIIELCSLLHGEDYVSQGRTVEKLGLAGKDVKAIRKWVLDGE
ncbi:MAG: NAD/NADP octopine/nopaline dehydrogenase family protein [Limnochordia bacterium]|jgi:opine dehydrogenase